MEPGGLMTHSQKLIHNPYLQPNQSNSQYGYLFIQGPFQYYPPIYVQIFLKVSFLQVYCYNVESTPTFFHSGYMICPFSPSRLNHRDFTRLTVQTMKFLIVEPSPLLIPIGPKYLPQNLFSSTLSLYSSLNMRDHVINSSYLK